MAVDPAQLKSEITADPAGMGYSEATKLKGSFAIEALINARDKAKHGTITVATVSRLELQKAADGAELVALPAGNQRAWLAVLSSDEIPINDAAIIAQVEAIWPAAGGSKTRVAIDALKTRPASRAEKLWGFDVYVPAQEIVKVLKV